MKLKMKPYTTFRNRLTRLFNHTSRFRLAPALYFWLCLALSLGSIFPASAGDYVLVVDTSGSMKEQVSRKDKRVRISVVESALREYLPALPVPSRVSLIAFNSGIVSEREVNLTDSVALKEAQAWVSNLERFTKGDGQTFLWTTLRHALQVATRYSREDPKEPVVVRVLTDGQDNEGVTSLDKVLREFPLVDGEHIRGNLVLLGDIELKTKFSLPEGAFTTTKSTTWQDIFPPVILWFPAEPHAGDDVRFVENTRSIYADYEWIIDGRSTSREKVLLCRFAEARNYSVMLRVKGIQGIMNSTAVRVTVRPKEEFTVQVNCSTSDVVTPGEKVRFWTRTSAQAKRTAWFVNGEAAASTEVFEFQFASEGTFTVKAIAYSVDGVSATNTQTLTVQESPLAVRIKAPNLAIAGQPIQFAAEVSGACAKVQWRFGDGATSWDKDPIHTFNLGGEPAKEFQMWVRAESPLGRVVESGPHTLRVQARHQIKPPIAAFGIVEQSIRVGEPLHLLDESQGYIENWDWRVGGVNVASEKNPIIRLAQPGPALVTLVVRGPGGSNEVSKQVTASPRFVPVQLKVVASHLVGKKPLSVQFTNTGPGDVRAWMWEFGDGHKSTNANPQHTFADATNYSVAVTAYPSDTNQPPCRAQLTITVTKPWPTWAKAILLTGVLTCLTGGVVWLVRREQRERLRLCVFWWPEQSAVCRRVDLNAPDKVADLKPEVPLRICRVGKTQNLVAEALDGATIVTGDGQHTTSLNIGPGARLVVKAASGAEKAVAVAVNQRPRRPSPATSELAARSPEFEPSAPQVSPSGEFDWGWDSASTRKMN